MDREGELNRLRWRSRRGMLELDLLLLPFFDEVFRDLEPGQQQTFVELLEEDDPDLLMWFSRKGVPENKDMADLVEFILKRVQP
jgi:antitoxin CptB